MGALKAELAMLRHILEEREDAIVERWLDRVLAAYPAEGGVILKRRTDRFANPIGHSARMGTRALFRALVQDDPDPAVVADALEDMLRIRAVQQMPPSSATGFVLELKAIVRDELDAARRPVGDPGALRAFEDRVDRLALAAFDLYVSFREELARLKVGEARRHVSWIVDRLNGEASARDADEAGKAGGAGAPDLQVSEPIQIRDTRVRGGTPR